MMHEDRHLWMLFPGMLWLLLVAVVIAGFVLQVRSRGGYGAFLWPTLCR